MSKLPAFQSSELADLARQLLFAPPDKRVEQVERAEKLHDEIDPAVNYPLDYLVYRLTQYRRDAGADEALMVGEAVRPDLRRLIDALSKSVAEKLTEQTPYETVDQLAGRLQVSTKTIHRWRNEGLRWRWVKPAGARKAMLGFTAEALRDFQSRHGQRIERAAAFSQIPEHEREAIIARARRLAAVSGCGIARIAAHLAGKYGRAVETIRLLLDKHDREHPQQPVFADRSPPLSRADERKIRRAYRTAKPVTRIAAGFGRSRATVYRVLRQHRAAVLDRLRLAYVKLEVFDREDADEVIMRGDGEAPATDREASAKPAGRAAAGVDDLPEELRPLYAGQALDDQAIQRLLLRYNYLKYRAAKARAAIDQHDPAAAALEAVERDVRQAAALRDRVIAAALPIVLSVARRQLIGRPEPTINPLLRLLDAGNAELLALIEQFNPGRKTAFTSQLTNRLLRRFARLDDQTTGATNARRAVSKLPQQATIRRILTVAGRAGRTANDRSSHCASVSYSSGRRLGAERQ